MQMKPLPMYDCLHQLLHYNPSTGALTWKPRPIELCASDMQMRRWNTRYANKPALASSNTEGYLTGAINKVPYQSHRIIFKMMTGRDPEYVDHINGDVADNRWLNLREVSFTENQQNQKRSKNNTSGTLGVYKTPKGWISRICVDRQIVNLGTYTEKEDAINVRKQAEIAHNFHKNHGR